MTGPATLVVAADLSAVMRPPGGTSSGSEPGDAGAASTLSDAPRIEERPPAGRPAGEHSVEREVGSGAPLGGQATSEGAREAGSDWPAQTAAESRNKVQILEVM